MSKLTKYLSYDFRCYKLIKNFMKGQKPFELVNQLHNFKNKIEKMDEIELKLLKAYFVSMERKLSDFHYLTILISILAIFLGFFARYFNLDNFLIISILLLVLFFVIAYAVLLTNKIHTHIVLINEIIDICLKKK